MQNLIKILPCGPRVNSILLTGNGQTDELIHFTPILGFATYAKFLQVNKSVYAIIATTFSVFIYVKQSKKNPLLLALGGKFT